jgi:hypothetical protein
MRSLAMFGRARANAEDTTAEIQRFRPHDQHGIQRVRRTPREQAAGARDRQAQSTVWKTRRAERLAGLGFPNLAGYLQRPHVEQGWSIRRNRAELRVGRRWLSPR